MSNSCSDVDPRGAPTRRSSKPSPVKSHAAVDFPNLSPIFSPTTSMFCFSPNKLLATESLKHSPQMNTFPWNDSAFTQETIIWEPSL